MFSQVKRITGKAFTVEVTQRDAVTLFPIIQQVGELKQYLNDVIHMGCNVHDVCSFHSSDLVLSSTTMNGEPTLNSLGYWHETVNHSENFVDLTTGAHTQTVKSVGFVRIRKH